MAGSGRRWYARRKYRQASRLTRTCRPAAHPRSITPRGQAALTLKPHLPRRRTLTAPPPTVYPGSVYGVSASTLTTTELGLLLRTNPVGKEILILLERCDLVEIRLSLRQALSTHGSSGGKRSLSSKNSTDRCHMMHLAHPAYLTIGLLLCLPYLLRPRRAWQYSSLHSPPSRRSRRGKVVPWHDSPSLTRSCF